MSVNFSQLPTERPAGFVVKPGQYTMTVLTAEMKQGKDLSKPPYLNLFVELSDPTTGATKGKIYDIISESPNEYARYKLSRLITATGLNLGGDFELKDLAKILPKKKCLVDIVTDTKSDPERSIIDIFSGEAFYPLNATTENTTATESTDSVDAITEDSPFDVEY